MPKQPGEIYEQARDGVVVVRTEAGSSGSGVVVGENEVATNCHVVDDGSPIGVWKLDPNVRLEGKPIQARVAAANMGDLCLLHVRGLRAKPVSIGSAKELRVGDAVYAMGTPKEWPLTFSGGLVSQLRGNLESPHIQTNAAISPGSSGGGLFDSEGRLVGIPNSSAEGGENLNFALPADWIESLRAAAPAEARVRQQLLDCLNAGDAREIPVAFRQLAGDIMQLHENPVDRASILGRIAREEARAGNKNLQFAKDIAEWSKDSDSQEGRDRVNFQAAWCYASAGSFTQAAKTAEQIRGEYFKLAARAVVAAEKAHSGDIDAARDDFGSVADIHQKVRGDLLWILAWALSEMNYIKEALDCAEMLRFPGDFVGRMRALSSIAGALARRNCGLGATALFQFAHGALREGEDRHESQGRGERVLSLGHIAWDEAECGRPEQAWASIRRAKGIITGGGIDHEHYPLKIRAEAQIAEVSAKVGGLGLDDSIGAISRIPVLCDDLAVALAYVAIATGRGA